jgi:hypothetical protein
VVAETKRIIKSLKFVLQEVYLMPEGGLVGIGTTNPSLGLLNIYTSGTSLSGLYVQSSSGPYAALRASMAAASNNTIVQAGDSGIIYTGGSIGTGAFVIAPWASATSGIRMDNNGNVGINQTSPAYNLDVNGTLRFYNLPEVTGVGTVCLDGSYPVSWTNSNSCVPSDRRLKERIEPLGGALDRIGQLKPVTFYWNKRAANPDKRRKIGLIAQDMEGVFPELVNTDSKGIKSISYDMLTAPLVNAMQELKALLDADHSDIAALKAENDELRARVEALEAARR